MSDIQTYVPAKQHKAVKLLISVITHRYTLKTAAALLVALFVFGTVHMFNATYAIVNSNGIHGIVARNTLKALDEQSFKAQAYDTIPYNYASMDY